MKDAKQPKAKYFPKDLCQNAEIDLFFKKLENNEKRFCITCGVKMNLIIDVRKYFCSDCGLKNWHTGYCCPNAHKSWLHNLFGINLHNCDHGEKNELIFIATPSK